MKSCQDISEKMLDYADGLMADSEKEELEKHIETCNNCRMELNKLETIVSNIRNIPLPQKLCPDTEILIRFTENDVTLSESREIKTHLEECLNCREEVTLLFELDQEVTPETCHEIYEKKVMPPSLMSQVKEIYQPPPQITRYKPGYNIISVIASLFTQRKWATSFATCALAVFMALNGATYLAPGLFTENYKMAEIEAPSLPSENISTDEGALSDINVSKEQGESEKADTESYENYNEEDTFSKMESSYKDKEVTGEGAPDYSSAGMAESEAFSNSPSSYDTVTQGVVPYDRDSQQESKDLKELQVSELTPEQIAQQHNFEKVLTQNLQNVLDEKFGPGNSVALVSSDITFSVNEPLYIPGMPPISPESAVYPSSEYSDGNKKEGSDRVAMDESSSSGEGKELEKDNKTGETYSIEVYPPGSINKINVSVMLNSIDGYNEKELEEAVANSVGIEKERGDNIKILNQSFETEDREVAQVVDREEQKTPEESTQEIKEETETISPSQPSRYSIFMGILSLLLASVFLVLGVKSILFRSRTH